MNAIATLTPARKPSKVELFMGQVLPAEDRAALKSALPSHVPFDRFERNLANALMNEPKLLECNPREVFREVAKIASLGLVIDAQLGECYLIVGYGKDGPKPQIRVGYRGLIKLARQSGEVAAIYAHEVCEADYIECELGTDKRLVHRPDLFGERGAVRGYYAVIKYKDGDTDFEPMSIQQIHAIRDKSDGYKAFKAGKIKDTPWNSGEGEMSKKTTIRRLMKRSPMSPDLAKAVRIEDEAEFPHEISAIAVDAPAALTPPRPPKPPSAPKPVDVEVVGQTMEEITGPIWAQEMESYAARLRSAKDDSNRLGECETEETLVEAIESFGGVFDDAPAEVQAEARKLEAAQKASIERNA